MILSKDIKNNFQNLLLKKLLAQLGNQIDIFWKFYLPKTAGQVLGYITGGQLKHNYLLTFTC